MSTSTEIICIVTALELIETRRTGLSYATYVYKSNINITQPSQNILIEYIPNPDILSLGYDTRSMLLTEYEYEMMPLPIYLTVFDSELPPLKTPFTAGILQKTTY
jgi:hypothetical protein